MAVRVLGRDGRYPAFEISTPNHLYVPRAEIVWTAVIQPALPDDWEVPEVATIVPEEVRLFAAIALCERDPWNHGWPLVTHQATSHHELSEFGSDLTSQVTRDGIASLVTNIACQSDSPWRQAAQTTYAIGDVGSHEDALDLLDNCDSTSELLLAGLSRLLESFRLMTSANEPDAAALSLFVSMGAALEFIRQHLEETGAVPASFADVYAYLGRIYPEGNEIADYLVEMYEHRIIATHPSGRLGDYWTPPLMADDIYHLRKHLMCIYRHIILGEEPALG